MAPATEAEKEDEKKPSEAELKAVALVRERDAQIQHLLQRLANKEADYITAQVTASSSSFASSCGSVYFLGR